MKAEEERTQDLIDDLAGRMKPEQYKHFLKEHDRLIQMSEEEKQCPDLCTLQER